MLGKKIFCPKEPFGDIRWHISDLFLSFYKKIQIQHLPSDIIHSSIVFPLQVIQNALIKVVDAFGGIL